MDGNITRAEHEEFRRRMEEHNTRQDRRLEILEKTSQQINSLTVSIEKLAQSIQQMVKEQENQGRRLEQLENQDGEMWRKVVSSVVTGVVGAVVGFVMAGFIR